MNTTVTTIRLSQLVTDLNFLNLTNQKIKQADSQYILLIDDKNNPVKLKNSYLDLMQMTMNKNLKAGMAYAGYENITKGKVEEVHLLKHHIGRIRDNQDYGKVFLFRRSFLEQVGGFEEGLKYKNKILFIYTENQF